MFAAAIARFSSGRCLKDILVPFAGVFEIAMEGDLDCVANTGTKSN